MYLRYARKYDDIKLTEAEVLQRFRNAYNLPYKKSMIRYVGDARPFWCVCGGRGGIWGGGWRVVERG